jgi:cytochrome d ubiquinol oxidase subunit II
VLAVATGAYLSAVFLAADAERAGLGDLVAAFRKRALGAAAVTGALAAGGLLVVRADARPLYDGLTSGEGLIAVIASLLAGAVTLSLLWRGRYATARWTSAVTVAAVVVGLALAQQPYFLPGALTIDQAAAGDSTMAAVIAVVVIAAIVLVPSLTLLYRLTLRGTLDTEFRPIVAADSEPRR